MKKGKFLSVLTSLAMTGSMMLSAIPFTASAEDPTDKIGLEMNADKTTFTLEEVQSGSARTAVYVDSTKNFTVDDQIVCVEFCLKPDQWGTVDPINLQISEPNQFSTDKGNKTRHFDTNATTTGSIWDTTPPAAFYGLYNYLDVQPGLVYADEFMPKATIMSSTNTGLLRTDEANANNHVANFEVQLPTDLAEGTYTINFVDAKAVIGDVVAGTALSYSIPDTKSITFTVGDGGTVETTAATTVATTKATTVATTEAGEVTTFPEWNFVGDCDLKAETGVKGNVGDTVDVPVYIDTKGKTIEGVAAKLVYDADALELVEFVDPLDAGYDESGLWIPSNTFTVKTSVFLIKLPGLTGMTNNPELPIVIAQFKIKDGAAGEYPIDFQNTLFENKEIEVVQETFTGGTPSNYLKVTKMPGSIIVGDGTTAATTEAGDTTTTFPDWNFVGDCDLKAETGVKGNVGDTVDVPVYIDTKGMTIEGVAAKLVYDPDALELVNFVDPLDAGYDESGLWIPSNTFTVKTSVFLIKLPGLTGMTNNPELPIVIAQFKIKEGAAGEYPISFQNTLFENKEIEVVQETFTGGTPSNYLKVTKMPGSIIVGDGTTAATSATADSTAATTKATPADTTVATTKATTSLPIGVVETTASKSVVIETEISKSLVIETEVSKSQVIETEISKSQVIETEVSKSQVIETEISKSEVIETVIKTEVVIVTKTDVSGVVVTETSISQVVVTEVSKSQVVETEISKSQVVVTETSISQVVVTQTNVSGVVVTSYSDVVVTNIVASDVVVTNVVTETSISQVVVTQTNVSGVVVTSYSDVIVTNIITNTVVSDVVVTETSISVNIIGTDVSGNNVTETVIVTVIVTGTTDVSGDVSGTDTTGSDVSGTDTTASDVSGDVSDTTTTTEAATTAASVSIVFSTDAVDLSGNNAFWYFADEEAWHLDAFAVEVNGEVVDGAKLEFSAASPKEAYDGENFDYEITVTYTHEDGQKVEAKFTAKIGLRGDANLDHKANARDAATIARDLAQLYATKKTTLTAEDGFGIFLANSDFVYTATPEAGKNGYAKKPTDYYGQYDLAVRDAAALATWLSRVYSDKDLTLYTVAVLKK